MGVEEWKEKKEMSGGAAARAGGRAYAGAALDPTPG